MRTSTTVPPAAAPAPAIRGPGRAGGPGKAPGQSTRTTAASRRRSTVVAVTAWSLAAVLAAGCSGNSVKDDPILRLSAEESLVQGKALMAEEKYARAREFLNHAFEAEPNSVYGREGLLLAADSLYLQRGLEQWIQAEAKYRDFLNRFPTSDKAPYVQLQIGNCLVERLEKPDRDQSITIKALEAFRDLKRLYPTSEEAAAADERIVELRDRLAEHEYLVGYFYHRYRLPPAAIGRWKQLLVDYPYYSRRDEVLYRLGMELLLIGEVEKGRDRLSELRESHPESEWAKRAAEELSKLPAPEPPAAPEAAEPEADAAVS